MPQHYSGDEKFDVPQICREIWFFANLAAVLRVQRDISIVADSS
jgi:hypothetical protein